MCKHTHTAKEFSQYLSHKYLKKKTNIPNVECFSTNQT